MTTQTGLPYSPTDLASPLIHHLGEQVITDRTVATLSNVHEDGTVTLERDGFVVAVVAATEVGVLTDAEDAHTGWCEEGEPHGIATCPDLGFDSDGIYLRAGGAA